MTFRAKLNMAVDAYQVWGPKMDGFTDADAQKINIRKRK